MTIPDFEYDQIYKKADIEAQKLLKDAKYDEIYNLSNPKPVEILFLNFTKDYLNGLIEIHTFINICEKFEADPVFHNMSNKVQLGILEGIKLDNYLYHEPDFLKIAEINDNLKRNIINSLDKPIMKNKLVFVTQNKNKVIDAQNMLKNYEIEHIDFDVPEIQSLNIQDVARYKVKYAYEQTKTPCFVWDVGLYLECLNDFPGPLIKWYFSKTVGPEKTCEIANFYKQYSCRWTTVLAYYDGEQTHFVEETVFGTIPSEPRGTNGFDWDVIFVPEGETRTLAEMTYEEKAEFAVTKKLLSKFEDLLTKLDNK